MLMTYSLGIGGSERQMAEVAKAIDRDRFEPHVGCLHSDGLRGEELRAAGVPILRLPITSFGSYRALLGAWQLRRYIRERKIELVHCFDVPMNIFAAPVAWLMRTPVVLTSQRADRLLTPGLYHRLLRVTDRLADGIVVNCQFMKRHLMNDERVPERLIEVCYNGVDTQVFQPGPANTHPRLAEASVVIGVVCALRPEKGLGTLVAAFARVAKDQPGARLLIVGSGPELSRLLAQAKELGVFDLCAFIPATDEVAGWLRTIDIFVLPSLSEALSNSLMEAMACGCCVVASNVGGNPELTGASERGLLFEAGNVEDLTAVLKPLIQDRERRQQLAAAAGKFIRSGFSTGTSVTRMQEIYSGHLDTIGMK
jgi:glycosyltransferase involved in cell wall biosynthesis